jgi:magnesium chelatase family protein
VSLGRAFSVAVRGLDGQIVEIEADIPWACPGCILSDCPTRRCRSPAIGCGRRSPIAATMARLTLALSPATLPKMGSVYDLALRKVSLSSTRSVSAK